MGRSRQDIVGFEHDWLASDEDGRVALFSTAGSGLAPDAYLAAVEAHCAAIDALLELPASTSARFAPAPRGDLVNTWKLVAERGLYAFDSDPNGEPYAMVAAPVVPVHLDALPARIAEVVARVRLRLRFEGQAIVTPDLLYASA